MRSRQTHELIEVEVVVEMLDILNLAQRSYCWPQGGEMIDMVMNEDEQEVRIRVQAPVRGSGEPTQ